MPPVCSHCKEIGHSLKHCRAAPILCNRCNSRTHTSETCQKPPTVETKQSQSRRGRAKSRDVLKPDPILTAGTSKSLVIPFSESTLGKSEITEKAEGSGKQIHSSTGDNHGTLATHKEYASAGVVTDSSNIDSSEAEMERSITEKQSSFETPGSKKKQKKKNKKGKRGKDPKSQ